MSLRAYIQSRNPSFARWVAPLSWAAWLSLGFGIFLPLLTMKKEIWIFEVDNTTWSLASGIMTMLTEGHAIIGLIVLLFSIIIPVFKLRVISLLWRERLSEGDGSSLLSLLTLVSKWSMLDVFVVAVLVVVSKLSTMADAEARIGVYVFAVHVLITMVLAKALFHYDRERLAGRTNDT